MSAEAVPIGACFVSSSPSGAAPVPSSSSADPQPTLQDQVRQLALLLAVETEVVPAVQSPASRSPVEGYVLRVSIVPGRPSAVVPPTSAKGKGRAVGKRQFVQQARERGRQLARVLVRLDQSAAVWMGEVALDENGRLLNPQPVLDPDVVWDGRSLQELYSSLPSPTPDSSPLYAPVGPQAKAVVRLLRDVNTNLGGLKTKLFNYQVTDVKQMALCELANPVIADLDFLAFPSVSLSSSQPPRTLYASLSSGRIVSSVDAFSSPRGGILCEEMGFGKTVCVLALILATKAQRASAPEECAVETPWQNRTTRAASQVLGHRVPGLQGLAAHALLASPFHSLHPSTLADLHPSLRDYLSLLEYESQLPYYWAPARELRGRTGANDVYREVPIFLGWGSLVLVPDNLLLQWKGMVDKHVEDGSLRTLIIDGDGELPPAERLAQDYDFVLMSHGRFARENGRAGFDASSSTSRPCKCYKGRGDGEVCTCMLPASPLVKVRWKRLVVDEGHVASSKTSDLVRLASLLSSERVWIVSGTPTPNLVGLSSVPCAPSCGENCAQPWPAQAKVDLSRLQAICAFLKVSDLSSSPWTTLIASPLNMGSSQPPDPGAVHRIDTLLQRLMVRHRLEDRSDAPLPLLHMETVSIAPSRWSSITFNLLLAIMHLNSLMTQRTGEGWLFSPSATASLRRLYENLSYSAFWLSSATLFDVVAKRWQAYEEVTEVDKGNRTYTQPDLVLLRDTHLHLEAGSDVPWQHMVSAFGSSLPARVRSLAPELAVAWGGIQPAGWADHLMNPSKLIRMRSAAASYLAANPEAHAGETIGYLVAKGRQEKEAEDWAAKRQEEIETAKRGGPRWWKEDEREEAERLAKAKQRALVQVEPFPVTPIVPSDFPLLNVRVVSTASPKLNHIVSEVLRLAEYEKLLVFSRDASALGLLTEMLDLVGVPTQFVGGILSRADRQETVSLFETGSETRVLLIELTQGARGLNLSSASRVIFCEPVASSDLKMQAIKRAHRVGQTKDVYVQTLVAKGTFEEQFVRQQPVAVDTKVPSKALPLDKRVADLLKASTFLEDIDHIDADAPGFDVPFWLSGTHHETMRKMRSGVGLAHSQPVAPLANNALRSLAPARRTQDSTGAPRRTAAQAQLRPAEGEGGKRVKVA